MQEYQEYTVDSIQAALDVYMSIVRVTDSHSNQAGFSMLYFGSFFEIWSVERRTIKNRIAIIHIVT